MAFFDNLKLSLKQKWLQFFQIHQSWINLQMDVESIPTPDGGSRPASYLILGVVNALEPQLVQLMSPFTKLTSNVDAIIEVLELNFDPNLVLEQNPQSDAQPANDALVLSDAEIAMMLQQEDIVIQALTDLDLDNLSDTSPVTALQMSLESAQLDAEKIQTDTEISRLFPNF